MDLKVDHQIPPGTLLQLTDNIHMTKKVRRHLGKKQLLKCLKSNGKWRLQDPATADYSIWHIIQGVRGGLKSLKFIFLNLRP